MVSRLARRQGFTLIELIIVIAIIAIIVAAVFVALDPVKRLNASRNSTRNTDITAIAAAIQLYKTDVITAGGTISTTEVTDGVAGTWEQIGTGGACNALTATQLTNCGGIAQPAAACRNLATVSETVGTTTFNLTPSYLPNIPRDPGGTAAATLYVIDESNGQVLVRACNVQGEGAGGAGPTPPAIPMQASR